MQSAVNNLQQLEADHEHFNCHTETGDPRDEEADEIQ
jgi:hypothetical protein